MFLRIDDFLIDRVFEPFAHKFQRLTGKTNFWLAKWGVVIGASSLGVALVGFSVGSSPALRFLYLFFLIIALLSATGAWLQAEELEKTSVEFPESANAARYSRMATRIVILLSTPVNLLFVLALWFIWPFIGVVAVVSGMSLFAAEYLLACTPLPPGTSKFRELLNKLLWKAHDALTPNPEPAPGV